MHKGGRSNKAPFMGRPREWRLAIWSAGRAHLPNRLTMSVRLRAGAPPALDRKISRIGRLDIEAARAELVGRGVDGTGPFHFGATGQTDGVHPERADYGTFMSFADPDGNGWLVQEVPARATRATA